MTILLFFHSIFRWLVLINLFFAVYRALRGYFGNRTFSETDNLIRHWAATIVHIQLLLGIILYTQSPNTKVSAPVFTDTGHITGPFFFGVIHLALMLIAIVILTIGSALAKRKEKDLEKFKVMLIWFSIALLIILIGIPWPFSPLAQRPYIHSFN